MYPNNITACLCCGYWDVWFQLVTKIGFLAYLPHRGLLFSVRHLSTLINQEIVGFQVSMGNAMFTSEMSGILLDFGYYLKEAGKNFLHGNYHELPNIWTWDSWIYAILCLDLFFLGWLLESYLGFETHPGSHVCQKFIDPWSTTYHWLQSFWKVILVIGGP